MNRDPIRGKTLRFTFTDGPMAKKAIEHSFDDDGNNVSWRMEGAPATKGSKARKCEIAPVGKDVYAVSYLSESGYTLTVLLDFATKKLVAFSSNDEELSQHHGTFEEVEEITSMPEHKPRNGHVHSTR